MRYWQIDSGRELVAATPFTRDVKSCQISSDGKHGLATDGATCVQFDLSSGKTQRTINTAIGWSTAAAISPTGGHLACCDGSRLRIWNLQSGLEIPNRSEDRETQSGLTFSHDGKRLYTGGRGKVSVWDIVKQQRIATLEMGGIQNARTIAVSSDGRFVAAIRDSAGQTLVVCTLPKP